MMRLASVALITALMAGAGARDALGRAQELEGPLLDPLAARGGLGVVLPEPDVRNRRRRSTQGGGSRNRAGQAEPEGHPAGDRQPGQSVAMLARIQAALGNKEDALGQARRAVELLPIGRDSFDGPIIAATAAAVSAQIGENDLAIEQLQSLVGIPNGPTPGLLRAEPEWHPLRDDPRFMALIERAA